MTISEINIMSHVYNIYIFIHVKKPLVSLLVYHYLTILVTMLYSESLSEGNIVRLKPMMSSITSSV